jgi:hypothetical protein
MTIPENYDGEIRPALAHFCGWRYHFDGTFSWHNDTLQHKRTGCPDPLRSGEDAWRLQCVLMSLDFDTTLFIIPPERVSYKCLLLDLGGKPTRHIADTPELALVMAAYEVVKRTGANV